MREQRQRNAVILTLTLTVLGLEHQCREGSLPARHRMQASPDPLPQPNAFPQRPALAIAIDCAQRDYAEPQSHPGPEQFANAVRFAGGLAQAILELA